MCIYSTHGRRERDPRGVGLEAFPELKTAAELTHPMLARRTRFHGCRRGATTKPRPLLLQALSECGCDRARLLAVWN